MRKTTKLLIASAFLMIFEMNAISSVFAEAVWPIEEGISSDWHYYYKETDQGNITRSIDLKFTLEILKIEEFNITYTLNWTEVTIEAKNNKTKEIIVEYFSEELNIEEGIIAQYNNTRMIELDVASGHTVFLIVMENATWGSRQIFLNQYENYTRNSYLATDLYFYETIYHAENMTHSLTGSSTFTGFELEYEINAIIYDEDCHILRYEKCQYTNDGILIEYLYKRIYESESDQNIYEEYLGNLNLLSSSTGFSISGFSLPLFFGMMGLTTLCEFMLIYRHQRKSRLKRNPSIEK